MYVFSWFVAAGVNEHDLLRFVVFSRPYPAQSSLFSMNVTNALFLDSF